MRRTSSDKGRWLNDAEVPSGAEAAPGYGAHADGAMPASRASAEAAPGWPATPSSHFQVPDSSRPRDAAAATQSAAASAVTAFPPHASPPSNGASGSGGGINGTISSRGGGAGGGSGGTPGSVGSNGSGEGGGGCVLRAAATAEAVEAKADAMCSAAGSALGADLPKHAPERWGGSVEAAMQVRLPYTGRAL